MLQIGGLGLAGLTLADWFRAGEALANPGRGSGRRDVSCIFLWLDGGPSHLETFDPKPDAPDTIRGPYGAIPTNVPGINIGELLPQLARCMDKCTLVRSMSHNVDSHSPIPMMRGFNGETTGGSDRVLQPWERYVWTGWYVMFIQPGAVAGILMTVPLLLSLLITLVVRWRSGWTLPTLQVQKKRRSVWRIGVAISVILLLAFIFLGVFWRGGKWPILLLVLVLVGTFFLWILARQFKKSAAKMVKKQD